MSPLFPRPFHSSSAMHTRKDKVAIIMGSTGTGKSHLSIDLATSFSSEIINSDKMQVYRGLDITTNNIPHHLQSFSSEAASFPTSPPNLTQSVKVKARLVHKDLELSVVAIEKNELANVPPFLPLLSHMVYSTFNGLKNGKHPILSTEGTGGTYLMQDSESAKYVSVFKPIDEEPMAVNNPRGSSVSSNGEGLKRGTTVGEGALREVAAYVLDHPRAGPRLLSAEAIGFAGVPPTVMVQCSHEAFNYPVIGSDGSLMYPKVGSLQMFMNNDGSCEDMGPRDFPVEEVHKITVLDIRIANADRHAGNILFRKEPSGKALLIPIDHGYCLPEKFEDCTFDWLNWPQAREPYSADIVDYINSLDAEKDIELLKYYGWDVPLECVQILRISTMLLKKGVERGLTSFAIGSIMCRENFDNKSVIEEIICKAQQESLLPAGMGEFAFLGSVSQIMDSVLDELSKSK